MYYMEKKLEHKKEIKAYIPNLHLELTPGAEIRRLSKVIEEKNELIKKFKQYDAERMSYCRRLEQNCAMMEEQFQEWREIIDDEYGKGSAKKFDKIRKEYMEKRQRASVAVTELNNVEQSLQKVISMLREMLAFAESRDTKQEAFYKTKLGSAMAYVDKMLTKVVACNKMFVTENVISDIDKKGE